MQLDTCLSGVSKVERKKRRRDYFRLGVALQALSSCLTGAGIAIELMAGADAGFILISVGSLLFGIACKLMKL